MQPRFRSLGYATDVALARDGGEVIERDRYVLLRTDSNPSFRWGNYLIYPDAPKPGDRDVWRADFARELPGRDFELFGWDRPDGEAGDIQSFLDAGFTEDTGVVLTTDRVHRAKHHDERIRVSFTSTDDDWKAAADCLFHAFGYTDRRSGTLEDVRDFVDRQLARYRRMKDLTWFGAWLGDRCAGTLGLFRVGDIGRYQLVGVDPEFQGRGVCATMVHEVARHALETLGLRQLVMAADESFKAARIYESVGFRRTERLVAVTRRPPRM